MNLVAKILLGVGSTGVTAASGYGIYEFIRPKNIAEKLSWEGKVVLSTEETNNSDDSDWNKIVDKYKTETATADKFSDLTLDTASDKADSNRKKLKEKCKGILNKKLSETDSETNLKHARYWCVKDSSKLDKTSAAQ